MKLSEIKPFDVIETDNGDKGLVVVVSEYDDVVYYYGLKNGKLYSYFIPDIENVNSLKIVKHIPKDLLLAFVNLPDDYSERIDNAFIEKCRQVDKCNETIESLSAKIANLYIKMRKFKYFYKKNKKKLKELMKKCDFFENFASDDMK